MIGIPLGLCVVLLCGDLHWFFAVFVVAGYVFVVDDATRALARLARKISGFIF